MVQFGTNHLGKSLFFKTTEIIKINLMNYVILGHFLLTTLLIELIIKTGTSQDPGRVIVVSSKAHERNKFKIKIIFTGRPRF